MLCFFVFFMSCSWSIVVGLFGFYVMLIVNSEKLKVIWVKKVVVIECL